MKMEIWPDDVSMPEMTDWLAELRDDGSAESAGDGTGERASADEASPEATVPAQADKPVSPGQAGDPAETSPPAQMWPPDASPSGQTWPPEAGPPSPAWPPEASPPSPAWPITTDTSPTGRIRVPAGASPAARTRAPAEASSRGRTRSRAKASARTEITERAVIGDQLRMPIMWCEMGSCISWHADPAALGEADIRARAIGVGWRVDALGRLACPRCQQTASGFRVSRPVVPWDRRAAITRATWMAGLRESGATGEHRRDQRSPASHRLAAGPPELEGRREHQPVKTRTVGRHAR